MREMLRNEIRYTNANDGIPADLDLETGKLGPPSLFGAAEYAKDGLIAVTELLGRTPWFYRMVDMTADAHGARAGRERLRPAAGRRRRAERRRAPDARPARPDDRRPALPRVGRADRRRLRAGGPARATTACPATAGTSRSTRARTAMRLRDHGNEIVVGLVLLHALETERGGERAHVLPRAARAGCSTASSPRPTPTACSTTRSAPSDLAPASERLSDNWGYVYGAVYTFYMVTGEARYRDAVRRVLRNLPRYRGHDWESGSQDGYADAIESALYLVNREPVPEALDWIETETKRLIAFQQPDGTIERWYGDGNWNRTLLLYAHDEDAGLLPRRLAARACGSAPCARASACSSRWRRPRGWKGRLRFDYARHRRVAELRPQLRPPQRVAGVVHGGREHALPR